MVKVYSREFAFHSFHSKLKRIGHRIEVREALNAVWDCISFCFIQKSEILTVKRFYPTNGIAMIKIIAETMNFVNAQPRWNFIWKRENSGLSIYLFCEYFRCGKISENGRHASQGAGSRRWVFVSIWENKLRMLTFDGSEVLDVSGPVALWAVPSVAMKVISFFDGAPLTQEVKTIAVAMRSFDRSLFVRLNYSLSWSLVHNPTWI